MNRKLSIALLMGGDSGEFDVSIGSAKVVAKFLDENFFDIYPILIRKNDWHYTLNEDESIQIDKNDFSLHLKDRKIHFDCAFIAIHGTPGEDGKLQGYLDLMSIPYTSCDLTTSALTFNKFFCNDIAIRAGMNVARTVLLRDGHKWTYEQLAKEVGLPCFIKPNKSGSSVGVTKVYNLEGFEPALKLAFAEDNEVQVQEYIKGREMACGVFRTEGRLVVLPVTEVIPKNDFFDYEAKYTSGMAEEVTPAVITPHEEDECRKMTAMLYEKFNCKGVVRFDYFLSEGKWWFLEVNTVPGFSEGSIIPKQAKSAGINLSDFFSSLVYEAIKQHK
ncbi:MAG: D-alanine--D-alanine ligase [Bacteroidales bacterium]|nr:D-alanine--D-alanine ligase [Bacteroidales bacterium]